MSHEHDPEAMSEAEPVKDSVVALEETERLKQREAMELELRAQSSALEPKLLHAKHTVPGAAPTALPEHERVRGETLSEEQLLSYRGKPLLDADGVEVGPIACVYLDAATQIPKWLGVHVGSLMGSQRVVAPVFGSYGFGDAISVPYSRTAILNAEIAATGTITPEQDASLYGHFGIPMSTERSPSGLPAGMDARRGARFGRWLGTPFARTVGQVAGDRIGLLTARSVAVRRRIGRWHWPWTRAA